MSARYLIFPNKGDDGSLRQNFPLPYNNVTALTDPTVNDDDSRGYVPASLWANRAAGTAFVCAQNTTGAALWLAIPIGQLTILETQVFGF